MEMQGIIKEGEKTKEGIDASELMLEDKTEGTRRSNQERLDIKDTKHT